MINVFKNRMKISKVELSLGFHWCFIGPNPAINDFSWLLLLGSCTFYISLANYASRCASAIFASKLLDNCPFPGFYIILNWVWLDLTTEKQQVLEAPQKSLPINKKGSTNRVQKLNWMIKHFLFHAIPLWWLLKISQHVTSWLNILC